MRDRERRASPMQRIQTTLELVEIGEALLRQRLRRASPAMSEQEIEAAVQAWYDRRPGAEHGDAPGTPRAI